MTGSTRAVARPVAWMEEIERYFDELPADVAALVIPLRGMVGGIGEYFLADDERLPPVLDYHEWLLADLGGSDGKAHADLRKQLFSCGYFWLAAVNGAQLVSRPTSGIGFQHVLAVTLFQQAADRRLAALLPPSSPAWARIEQAMRDAAAANILREDTSIAIDGGAPTQRPRPISEAGRQWAPFVSLTLAAAHHLHRDDLAAPLNALIYRMNAVWQIYGDMLNLRHDAQHGIVSFAIERLRHAAQLPRDAAAEQILAALVTTDAADAMLTETVAAARDSAADAQALGLRLIAERCIALADASEDLRQALGYARTALSPVLRSHAPATPTRDATIVEAMERAQAYLLADTEMREAWDVYRTGFLGEPVRTGRPFPVGFTLENLAATGMAVRQQIDATLRLYAANRGDYFDGAGRLARDVDTWGLMLRLASRTEPDAELRALLLDPLSLIQSRLARDGDIPVWVMETAPPDSQTVLYGMHCTTCQVNLLLGLAVQPASQFDALLDAGLRRLLVTLRCAGTARTSFYSPRYLVWMLHELVLALRKLPVARTQQWTASLQQCLQTLRRRERLRIVSTPQQAALAVLAGVAASDEQLDRHHQDTMLRQQRPDGGWNAEPLYWAPTQQSPGYWYGSRTATTSLCYRALALLRDRQRLANGRQFSGADAC